MNADLFLKERSVCKLIDGSPKSVSFEEVSSDWQGRGIVLIAGRPIYLANAYMNLCFIRKDLGCRLPVEVWHLGGRERNERMFDAIRSLGDIRFVDAHEMQMVYPMRPNTIGQITRGVAPATTEGWRTKSYALLHSNFREVIYLDSDCFLFQKPETLFENLTEYLDAGAVFSADIDACPHTVRGVDSVTKTLPRVGTFTNKSWDYSAPNPIWRMLGIDEDELPEFDSGFMMIDKARHVDPVFVTFFLNENSDVTYKYLYGDKDTFHIAWAFCRARCRVLKDVSRDTGHIISRAGGSVLFEHRVFLDKFNIDLDWDSRPNSNDFHRRDSFRTYFEEAKKKFSARIF